MSEDDDENVKLNPKDRGLGRGLDALFGDEEDVYPTLDVEDGTSSDSLRKTVGIENIMFSVDTPYEDLNFALNWFDKLKLSDSKRKKIAYKNANKILKIFPNKKNFKLIK